MEEGDIVSYGWGGEILQGLFLRYEARGPGKTKCAILDVEGKGEVAVRSSLIISINGEFQ